MRCHLNVSKCCLSVEERVYSMLWHGTSFWSPWCSSEAWTRKGCFPPDPLGLSQRDRWVGLKPSATALPVMSNPRVGLDRWLCWSTKLKASITLSLWVHPSRSYFGVWFSSYQPYWTQPRSPFHTPLPDTLVSYVSEQSFPSMHISEFPGESVDLLDVLKGSAVLVHSWTLPWDVDDMAVFMMSLGHWDLSPALVPLTSHWWFFSTGPWPHGSALSLHWYGFYTLRWWYLHVPTFLDLWVPFSIAFGYYVWKYVWGEEINLNVSCWSEISLVSVLLKDSPPGLNEFLISTTTILRTLLSYETWKGRPLCGRGLFSFL